MKNKLFFLLPIIFLSLSGCALNLSGPEGPDSGEVVSVDKPSSPESGEDVDNQGPDSGEDEDNQGPDSGEDIDANEPFSPESGEDDDNQGPDSGEDADNQGPDSGDDIDTNEPSSPESGEDADNQGPDSGEDADNQDPDSGEEIDMSNDDINKSKGSCNMINDSSVCVSYIGAYWNDNNMKLHCDGGETFTKNPCPVDSLGGCKSGVGTPNENIIWHYGRGGQPFDAESIGYSSKACSSVSGMIWIAR